MTPDLPARIQQLLEEVDLLREAGLQLWLSAGSAERILGNGQWEIPGVRDQVRADLRSQMAAFKATRDRQFYPWETADPHDPRFQSWVQGGERLTTLVLNTTVYRREGHRFVHFGGQEGGCYWLPEEAYGEEPVQAARKLGAEMRARREATSSDPSGTGA